MAARPAYSRHAAGLLLLLTIVGACERDRGVELRPGEELFAIADGAVLEVSMRAGAARAQAQRPVPEQPFSYRFEHADGRSERCAASTRLDSALATVRTIHVRDVPAPAERRKQLEQLGNGAWIALEVRSIMTDQDPFRLELRRDPRDERRLWARIPGEALLFTVDSRVLALMELDCKAP